MLNLYFIYLQLRLADVPVQANYVTTSSLKEQGKLFFDSAVAWVVEGTGGGAEVGQQSTQPPDRESSG